MREWEKGRKGIERKKEREGREGEMETEKNRENEKWQEKSNEFAAEAVQTFCLF